MIDIWIVLADLFGCMGEIELDRPTAARFQVDEQQPMLGVEHVAWMRLAVQKLLGGAALLDSSSQTPQRGAEEIPVRVGERWGVVAARQELLRTLNSICEAWRRDIELAHAGMQPLERMGVIGWWNRLRCDGFVVGPQRDHEAITLIDTRFDSRLESSDRVPGLGEALSKLNFENCDLLGDRCHPGQDVTRQKAQSELVRVIENDRVVD